MSRLCPPLTQIPAHLINIAQYQQEAKKHLSPDIWSYIDGGAMHEHSLQRNLESWQDIQLLPRYLQTLPQLDTHCEILGQTFTFPLLLAPVAYQKLYHDDGEYATALASEATQTPFILSSLTTTALQDVAHQFPQSQRWFQVYWQGDRQRTLALIQQAEAAHYQSIVFTVDAPHMGIRDRERLNQFQPPEPALTPHAPQLNCADIQQLMAQTPTWDDISWLAQQSSLPIIIKGIIHHLDAKLAVEHGAQGIIISNHGGRVLDGICSPITVLPKIRATVPDHFCLLLDSGIRRGTDIFKALALGANAVLIGRAYIYGLTVAGALGAAHCIKILQEELSICMALMGTENLSKITSQSIAYDFKSQV